LLRKIIQTFSILEMQLFLRYSALWKDTVNTLCQLCKILSNMIFQVDTLAKELYLQLFLQTMPPDKRHVEFETAILYRMP